MKRRHSRNAAALHLLGVATSLLSTGHTCLAKIIFLASPAPAACQHQHAKSQAHA